jgi:hypothetical protein
MAKKEIPAELLKPKRESPTPVRLGKLRGPVEKAAVKDGSTSKVIINALRRYLPSVGISVD